MPATPQPSERDRTTPADDESGILPDKLQERRDELRDKPTLNLAYRIGVGIVGTAVLIAGIVAIPYPGPGWLIVFLGLGILATEFVWAQKVLTFVRRYYDRWMEWMSRQHWSVKVLFGVLTCAIVLLTLWLLGALKMAGGWVGVEASWLASPLLG